MKKPMPGHGNMPKRENSVGQMMPHEKHVMDEDNVMHHSNFSRGKVHPDSKGSSAGMDGDAMGADKCLGH